MMMISSLHCCHTRCDYDDDFSTVYSIILASHHYVQCHHPSLCFHSPILIIQASLRYFHSYNSRSNSSSIIKAEQQLLLEPYDWVQKHFKDRIAVIVSIDDMKSDTGLPCIINKPHITMDHPYLEGQYLDTAIKSLDEVLKQEPDSRSKDLIATVRGSGGGKTRMLEELRRATNRRNDAVAIGVTFNNNTLYDKVEEDFIKDERRGLNIILSIICRICCVVYNDPKKEILKQSAAKEFIPKLSRDSFLYWRGILIDASKSLKCQFNQ